MMFCVAYSDFRDKRVVNVPDPAIKGNASGTIDTLSETSSLKRFIPNIISIAIMKITIEPAIANDDTSSPIIRSSSSPANKNKIMISKATIDAFPDCRWPALFRNVINIGMDPSISMIANNIIVTDKIWL